MYVWLHSDLLQALNGERLTAALPANFLWRNYVGDFGLVAFALHVLHWRYPKSERNKTRLTLAPNRGCLGVLWTYSGSGVVLSWDLTRKNTQTSTQAHRRMSRHTDPSSLNTNTHGSPRPRIKTHAFAQRQPVPNKPYGFCGRHSTMFTYLQRHA